MPLENAAVVVATKGGTPARLGYYDNYLVDQSQLCDRWGASDGGAP